MIAKENGTALPHKKENCLYLVITMDTTVQRKVRENIEKTKENVTFAIPTKR